MSSRKHIQEELNTLNSSLPAGVGMPPFSIPEGYFDGLAAEILSRLQNEENVPSKDEIAQLSPLLAGISRKSPFSVPEGYFQSTIDSLPSLTEEEKISFLSVAHRKMPYEVPSGYFDGLPAQVMSKLKPPQARVVPMHAKKWMRMAVAAVVAGIITVSGIAYFSGKQDMAVDNPQWVAKKLQNVSDKELEEFVKTSDVNQASIAVVKTSAIRTSDVKRLLQDVPDNELDAFLEQMPSDEVELSLN